MTIIIRLGGGTVMAAVPAASPEGKPIYLKLNKQGDTQLPWETHWKKESLPKAVKSLLFHIIRYNQLPEKEKAIRLVIGCPVTEEWADSGKREEMAELIRKAAYAAEVRVVWEVFPAVLGVIEHCRESALSVYDGFGIVCLETSYAALIYVRSVKECFCADWRTDSGSWKEEDFLKVCMDAGRKMEEQGIMVRTLILTGCKAGAAFAERTLGRIFTEAEIVRPMAEDFLMADGLILDERIEEKRDETIQSVTRTVLQYRFQGWGSSLSELQENLERTVSREIKRFLEDKENGAASVKKMNRWKPLGEQVKKHPDYRDSSITYWIKEQLEYWESRVTDKVWNSSYEEIGSFVPKQIMETLSVPDNFWRRQRRFLNDAESKALSEKLREKIFALRVYGWESKLKKIIERVLDQELRERFCKSVECMAAHSCDSIMRRYDRCGREVRPADANSAVFDRLSLQCRMGDMEAMYEMALWHRNQCNDKERSILQAYEKDPDDKEARAALRKGGDWHINNYTVWLVRAALYGHEKSGKILERYSLYREVSLLPEWVMTSDEKEQNPMRRKYPWFHVQGFQLRKAGFTEVPNVEYEGALKPLQREGYYVFSYLRDYIAADEDGFGREDDYGHVFLDEFFNILPIKEEEPTPETLRKELDKMDAGRERYWSSPFHDCRRRAQAERQI